MSSIIITTINCPRSNDPKWRFLLQHGTNLYRRRVGPEEKIILNEECVLHVPGRVVFGKVEGFEIVVVELYFRPFCHHETESGKDVTYLLDDKGDRMLCTLRAHSPGQGHINPLAFEPLLLQLF